MVKLLLCWEKSNSNSSKITYLPLSNMKQKAILKTLTFTVLIKYGDYFPLPKAWDTPITLVLFSQLIKIIQTYNILTQLCSYHQNVLH